MSHLYQVLAERVQSWRAAGYPCPEYQAIAEVLEYQYESESGGLRFLRKPQMRALEIYWYLRLVEKTPHVFDLYRRLYAKQSELLNALGLTGRWIQEFVLDNGIEALWRRIRQDDDFVREHRLESLRETLTLDYPSYILALAMGTGKTVLIGTIIATEFGMALEYPDGPFVQNALVFAPGKTIIESLRELAEIPYGRILPPRLFKHFAASVKLTFTRDGEPTIPITAGSIFNVVVTNTEKIRIQKRSIRRRNGQLGLAALADLEKRLEEEANLRLQAIASLPHLAVFSDEAHHTYGQAMGEELKRVRQTVDYLHQNSPNLICVVNTTGTPYYARQPLKDVVMWYGLSAGIADGILKEVGGNIKAYSFSAESANRFIEEVVTDFFRDYGNVHLENGTPAKLAIYFPQTDDLEELRPAVETALAKAGYPPSIILTNTSDSTKEEVDAFNRLNDPGSPHRVILLVNKGTEGWNCPSLFACALARKLKTSNNFVLQASTRCLRQVPGNVKPARIYLSIENRAILDRQLQETYGETITDLGHAWREICRTRIKVRKLNIPPLAVTQLIRTVGRKAETVTLPLRLNRPEVETSSLTVSTFTLAEREATDRILRQLGETVAIESREEMLDLHTAASQLAAIYRLNIWSIYNELKRLYSEAGELPLAHLDALAQQIEDQTRHYEVTEERVERALALVKLDGFQKETDTDGTEIYTAEISYQLDREHLLTQVEDIKKNDGGFGFHYTPYNFDSNPEKSFFEEMLAHLNLHPEEVEDIYFTGALTDPDKTDFFVEYKDEEGKWRRYTPDFIIRKKSKDGVPGRCLIVEIKAARERGDPVNGENGLKAMALRKWADLNPDRLKYEMIFTGTDAVTGDQTAMARRFVEEAEA